MLNDLISLTAVVVLVPLAAIMILRMFGKTKRTKRPIRSFRIGQSNR